MQKSLADTLYRHIPAGVGSTGAIRLNQAEMDAMLFGGAVWAVKQGFGSKADLERIEEQGQMAEAQPECVSDQAKKRQRDEMGTLGSGNHYLEVQNVAQIFDARTAKFFGIDKDDVLVSIHCGSRGLGHQIGTEFLKKMVVTAPHHRISLPDRELACAPISSPLGREYLGAMRAAINCALANRQILTHLLREAFAQVLPKARLSLLYDVSHNTCKIEQHLIDGRLRQLYIHRKGATRALGPGHPDIPEALREVGQPVLIGGSMGTCSYILTSRTLTIWFTASAKPVAAGWKRRICSTPCRLNSYARSSGKRCPEPVMMQPDICCRPSPSAHAFFSKRPAPVDCSITIRDGRQNAIQKFSLRPLADKLLRFCPCGLTVKFFYTLPANI